MQSKERTYFCVDMKCFFASVECVERGLNPFETNLVVADASRGNGGICLAISPKLKAQGVKNRCRLFEIPKTINYITAKPQMKKYIEYSADIYGIYLKYVSSEDIHVYSIDEAFLDVTDYLKCYKISAYDFAKLLIEEIATIKGIPATVGIGTNLYLAKIALDISAKKNASHIAFLNEELYKKTLWKHQPITDFWQIANGTAKRLAKYGIFDMKGIATADERLLYRIFGINAELLIDHANGKEPCLMKDIKAYKGKSHSVSTSQILFSDYAYDKALLVLMEMTLNGCQELMKRGIIAKNVGIAVGYSKDVIPPTKATIKMVERTNVYSVIKDYVKDLYEKTANKTTPIRKLSITFFNVIDESQEGYDMFCDYNKIQKEKAVEKTVLEIKDKFGKNAMLRCTDLTDGATATLRNKLIGGHNSE
ncbi:MAG: DNA repair protein [Clostridia bacterium]|nr:DNA repair protein [Clostridia bacterium]